jgi:hypothetical protein
MTQEQQEFIDNVKDGAIHTMQQYGVLASMTIAQAILESGWGKTGLAQTANNLFGIKRHGAENYVTVPTREYNDDGSSYMIQAEFRAYGSWEESILDHGKFLVDNKRYSKLIGLTDYKESCTLIRADGYATDPAYGDMLIGIIERYNLNQYDVIENTESEDDTMIKFNEEYYLEVNPDVKAAVESGQIESCKWHYDNYGKAEGRRGFPQLPAQFCEGVYLENNQDINEAVARGDFSCGAEHWLKYGWKDTNRMYSL